MDTVTEYLNYRDYLKDWIEARKNEGLPGSNRWFAQKMEINSTSWLTSILSGDRSLNEKHLTKLTDVLKFSAKESRFFKTLVAFNQAKEREEKNRYFDTLKKLKVHKDAATVSGQFYEYYQNWYNSAVRALIGIKPFKDAYKELASQLQPTVPVVQVKESVALLENIGFIQKNTEGYFELTEAGITTGDYERSVAVANFQEETIDLAKRSLKAYAPNEREIATLTLGISKKRIAQVKDILAEARRAIADIADCDDDADSVYHLNMQLFPMSIQVDSEKGAAQ